MYPQASCLCCTIKSTPWMFLCHFGCSIRGLGYPVQPINWFPFGVGSILQYIKVQYKQIVNILFVYWSIYPSPCASILSLLIYLINEMSLHWFYSLSIFFTYSASPIVHWIFIWSTKKDSCLTQFNSKFNSAKKLKQVDNWKTLPQKLNLCFIMKLRMILTNFVSFDEWKACFQHSLMRKIRFRSFAHMSFKYW